MSNGPDRNRPIARTAALTCLCAPPRGRRRAAGYNEPSLEKTYTIMTASELTTPTDFLRAAVADDMAAGRFDGRVRTRFPPEPNGYLHIGHAKAICIDFGIARDFGGQCNLRFDDTNPVKEDTEYVDGIKADIRWLGFEWGGHELYASDYFEQLYEFALR